MKRRLLKKDINAEKLFPSGMWLCSAMIDGEYVKKRYMGYTKRAAINLFYNEHKGGVK